VTTYRMVNLDVFVKKTTVEIKEQVIKLRKECAE